MSGIRPVLFAPLLATVLVAAPMQAPAEDFYKGKTITLIVGFSAGGGYDTYARALARVLPSHIPGDPTVIVQNMPGAGSLVAIRSVAFTQPKDGTVMATFEPGLITQSLTQPERVKLDFRKYAWIGVVTPNFKVCYGYGPHGVKSWDDLMHRKQFILGAEGTRGIDYINGAALREVFGAPVKQVLGFPGSAEVRLAVERGELDGDCGSFSSIPPEWLRDGKAHVFVRFTRERLPEMPAGARYIDDFATTQEQKDLFGVLDAGTEIGRPYVMSGAVPASHIAIMRKAFDETMKDPAFLAMMKKEQLPVYPLPGAKAEQIVEKMMGVSPAIIAKAKKLYK